MELCNAGLKVTVAQLSSKECWSHLQHWEQETAVSSPAVLSLVPASKQPYRLLPGRLLAHLPQALEETKPHFFLKQTLIGVLNLLPYGLLPFIVF